MENKQRNYDQFGLPIVEEFSPMSKCKPPNKETDWKKESLKRIEYLEYMLHKAYDDLIKRSIEHGEICIITGKSTPMCFATFDNLDRICRDVKLAIDKIK